jgi:hypothetical protein
MALRKAEYIANYAKLIRSVYSFWLYACDRPTNNLGYQQLEGALNRLRGQHQTGGFQIEK